jgi:hypothetical protein
MWNFTRSRQTIWLELLFDWHSNDTVLKFVCIQLVLQIRSMAGVSLSRMNLAMTISFILVIKSTSRPRAIAQSIMKLTTPPTLFNRERPRSKVALNYNLVELDDFKLQNTYSPDYSRLRQFSCTRAWSTSWRCQPHRADSLCNHIRCTMSSSAHVIPCRVWIQLPSAYCPHEGGKCIPMAGCVGYALKFRLA